MLRHLTLSYALCCLIQLYSPAQTGIPVPEMSGCDEQVQEFMDQYGVPGLTLAIARQGRLLYMRAFGHTGLPGSELTQPYHLFRIASISKPITAVGIMKLLEEGRLSLSDKVFGPGGLLENHAYLSQANITDERIYDITVQHLLEHSAGWNRSIDCTPAPTSPYPWHFGGCDPIDFPLHAAEVLGAEKPASEEVLIRFLLEKGLNFTPGGAYAYSNIGFLILGEVIEELEGMPYEEWMKAEILEPAGICDMHLGNNLLEDRLEREGGYIASGQTLSCYGTGEFVPWQYGGLNYEAMGAHGGWIATARDLVRFLLAVDGFSTKPDILQPSTLEVMTTPSANASWYARGWVVNSANTWFHDGSLPGTRSFFVRTANGYTWAVITNYRTDAPSFSSGLDGLPWGCIASANGFPGFDLLDSPGESASALVFSAVEAQSVELSWSNGDGDKRIVLARRGAPVEVFPLDGTDYESNPVFGMGSPLGEDTYAVYNGDGSSVIVEGLEPNTEYHFRIFEYNQRPNTGEYALYRLCNSEQQSVLTDMGSAAAGVPAGGGLQLFPNPASDVLNFQFGNVRPGRFCLARIFNSQGQLVKSVSIGGQQAEVDIGLLPRGAYCVVVNGRAGERWHSSFLKNK